MIKRRKKLAGAALIILVIITFVTFSIIWIYRPGLNGKKLKILSALSLPIASVNGKLVFAQEFLEIKNSFTGFNQVSDEEIYNSFILNKKYEALQKEVVSKPIYKNPADSIDFLKKFDAIKKGLALFYNSNQNLNSESYTLANNILLRLKEGESFESLAKTYSTDSYSSIFGGLTGGNADSFLPETQVKINEINGSEPVIIPSSLGLHIIKKDQKTGNFRQIFLKTTGFEEWLQNSSKQIKTKKFINP